MQAAKVRPKKELVGSVAFRDCSSKSRPWPPFYFVSRFLGGPLSPCIAALGLVGNPAKLSPFLISDVDSMGLCMHYSSIFDQGPHAMSVELLLRYPT